MRASHGRGKNTGSRPFELDSRAARCNSCSAQNLTPWEVIQEGGKLATIGENVEVDGNARSMQVQLPLAKSLQLHN